MALEEPKFEVIAEFDDVEIRRYEPYVVAEVDVSNDSSGFRKLAGYIFAEPEASACGSRFAGLRRSSRGDRLTACGWCR